MARTKLSAKKGDVRKSGKAPRSSDSSEKSKFVKLENMIKKNKAKDAKNSMPKRFKEKNLKSPIDQISRYPIQRVARRYGVKRVRSNVYPEAKEYYLSLLKDTLNKACIYAHHSRKKTISDDHIRAAIERNGHRFCG